MDTKPIYALLILAGILLVVYGSFQTSGSFDESQWHKFSEALSIAKKENKMILVFVTSPTCIWCERMKKDVFSDRNVIEKIKTKYVPAIVDVTKDREVEQIANLFGGDFATPAFVIYSPDGKPLDGWVGYMDKDEFLKRIGVE